MLLRVPREIANALVAEHRQPEMRQLLAVYEATVFRDLVYSAQKAAKSGLDTA